MEEPLNEMAIAIDRDWQIQVLDATLDIIGLSARPDGAVDFP